MITLSRMKQRLETIGGIALFAPGYGKSSDEALVKSTHAAEAYYRSRFRERWASQGGNQALSTEGTPVTDSLVNALIVRTLPERFLNHSYQDTLGVATFVLLWENPFTIQSAISAFSEQVNDSGLKQAAERVFLDAYSARDRALLYRKTELPILYREAIKTLNQGQTMDAYLELKFCYTLLLLYPDAQEDTGSLPLLRECVYNIGVATTRLAEEMAARVTKQKGSSKKSASIHPGQHHDLSQLYLLEAAGWLRPRAEEDNKKRYWRLLALIYARSGHSNDAQYALQREKSALP